MFSRAFAYRYRQELQERSIKVAQWPSLFSFSLSDLSNSENIPAGLAEGTRPELEVLLEQSIPGIAKS